MYSPNYDYYSFNYQSVIDVVSITNTVSGICYLLSRTHYMAVRHAPCDCLQHSPPGDLPGVTV